ncbi:MAG: hypothetical protein ACRDT1_13025 [Micromonosporaceae bacterium]
MGAMLEPVAVPEQGNLVRVLDRSWVVAAVLDPHDLDGAVWTARRGLEACKTHSRLTKLLMEAHLARGEAEAARRVFESHQAALEKLELDDLAADLVDVCQAARGDRG